MPNLNKVMLMGNLTRDPELRYTPQNNAVANIGLAINRKWRNQNGEQQEETTFVDCEAWGRTAEVLNQYLRKGRPVFIEGRLRLDQWQDKEGQNRSKLKVVVDTFQFIDSQGGGQGGQGGGEAGSGGNYQSRSAGGGSRGPARSQPGPSSQQPHPADAGMGSPGGGPGNSGPGHQPIDEDDIPF